MSHADADTVAVEFDDDGLVPVVAQDADSGGVLMVAYATREALSRTHETGQAHYYSRSREELWEKGGSSGHTQSVEEIRVDCDADTVLYLVEQSGGACHTGYESCFHRRVDEVDGGETSGEDEADDQFTASVTTVGEQVFDPDEVY